VQRRKTVNVDMEETCTACAVEPCDTLHHRDAGTYGISYSGHNVRGLVGDRTLGGNVAHVARYIRGVCLDERLYYRATTLISRNLGMGNFIADATCKCYPFPRLHDIPVAMHTFIPSIKDPFFAFMGASLRQWYT